MPCDQAPHRGPSVADGQLRRIWRVCDFEPGARRRYARGMCRFKATQPPSVAACRPRADARTGARTAARRAAFAVADRAAQTARGGLRAVAIAAACYGPAAVAAAEDFAALAPTPLGPTVQALPPGVLAVQALPGWRVPDGARVAALRLALEPGWKTYWRIPGEAGIPPVLDFTGSHNIADIEVIWPVPDVFDDRGARAVGYVREMILPLRIRPTDAEQPVILSARLDLGVCRDICVPVSLDVSADLTGPGQPDARISQAMAAIPRPVPEGAARCRIEPITDGMRVQAQIDVPPSAGEVALLELRSQPMWVSDPVISRDGEHLLASVDFVPDAAQPFALDPGDLRITVLGAGDAIEIDGCPAP